MAKQFIIVTVKENCSLSVFNAGSGEKIHEITVGIPGVGKPHEITLSADKSKAFISLYGDKSYQPENTPWNQVAVVDLKTWTLLGHIDLNLYRGPHGMATDSEGKIWVTVDPNDSCLVIDPESWEIERTIWYKAPGHFIAPSPPNSPFGEKMYISHKEYPVVTEVDVATKQITAQISLPVGGQGLACAPDGRHLFVGDFHRSLLHIVDLEKQAHTDTVPLTAVPGWPFPSKDGNYLVVNTYDESNDKGYCEIFNGKDLSEKKVIELPAEPFHLLYTADNTEAYAALADGQIIKINLAKAEIIDGGFHAGGKMPEALMFVEG
ncbi:MAG: hypothetical protein AAF485_15280 [Chloroflexota bacterium]